MLQKNDETSKEQARHGIQEIRNSIQKRGEGDSWMMAMAIWGQQAHSKPGSNSPHWRKRNAPGGVSPRNKH